MALSFTRLPWWWLGSKEKEKATNGSSVNSINSLCDWGSRGESESLKFYSVKGSVGKVPPLSDSKRNSKRKWKSREERKRWIDKEYDVVLVPSDAVCLSGWESDDSDWSIGWLEPHAPDFQGDVEADCSFAVLVPCYRRDCKEVDGKELASIKKRPNDYSSDCAMQCCILELNLISSCNLLFASDGKKYIEQWLSSLQDF